MPGDSAFDGFPPVGYTQVPDAFFDELAPNLKEGELRVLLYIFRRTFGFKKHSDDISLSQMVSGITRRNGDVLDRGTGMGRPAVVRAIQGLIEKGVVVARHNASPERGHEPTTYTLRFKGDPWFSKDTTLVSQSDEALVSLENPQETVLQETVYRPGDTSYPSILRYRLRDIGKELRDTDQRGSVGRIVNLWRQSGLPVEEFLLRMYQARDVAKEAISKGAVRNGEPGRRNAMAYWFKVLEQMCKLT